MSGKTVVPTSINAFNTYVLLVLLYLTDNASRLLIAPIYITDLNGFVTDATTGWTHWFNLHASPSTNNGPNTTNLHVSETKITKHLQLIYGDIPRSLMNADDYANLHIAPPVTSRPKRTAIINIPFGKVYSIGGAIVHFIVRTDTHAHRAAMDPLADAIEVSGMLIAADAPLPTDNSKCDLHFMSKEALFNHAFTPADAGKRFVCFLRYVNLTDETKDGGWSGVISTIIGM
jgi:hypothetical protein